MQLTPARYWRPPDTALLLWRILTANCTSLHGELQPDLRHVEQSLSVFVVVRLVSPTQTFVSVKPKFLFGRHDA